MTVVITITNGNELPPFCLVEPTYGETLEQAIARVMRAYPDYQPTVYKLKERCFITTPEAV